MAFSIHITRETELGAIVKVLVALNVAEEVTLKYIDLAGSVAPSATVVVASASELKQSCVPYANASPISSRLVLVDVPQVPDSSPVVISFKRKSFTYVAIRYPCAGTSSESSTNVIDSLSAFSRKPRAI